MGLVFWTAQFSSFEQPSNAALQPRGISQRSPLPRTLTLWLVGFFALPPALAAFPRPASVKLTVSSVAVRQSPLRSNKRAVGETKELTRTPCCHLLSPRAPVPASLSLSSCRRLVVVVTRRVRLSEGQRAYILMSASLPVYCQA